VSARSTRGTAAAALALVVSVGLAGCAELPVADPSATATVAAARPAVAKEQSEQVRADVAARLLEARVAGDPALVEAAATGPAARIDQLRVRVDGPLPDAEPVAPVTATVLVAPQVDGWPRWFATVTDPSVAVPGVEPADPSAGPGEPTGAGAQSPAPSEAAGEGADGEAVTAELPVIEVYDAAGVRSPYRLWARLTMLPGADLPAFADPEVGAGSLGDGVVAEPSAEASDAASLEPSEAPGPSEEPAPEPTPEPTGDAAVDAELQAVLAGLAGRYAAVMTDGDASEQAAAFEPDPFVEAVRARAAAERESVAAVADTTVTHTPFGGGEVLYAARAANGDVLAVTAVTTTTVMTVRPGAGVLRPGTEVRAAAGIEETDGTLTTRSVAALAFVVPAEQGAIRLVAVGEGLVAAEAS
jgi:hypothetical protein